ncbi:MAG: hypothetical protein AB1744_01570 [Candidatus Zixiibacteriota bacterium]
MNTILGIIAAFAILAATAARAEPAGTTLPLTRPEDHAREARLLELPTASRLEYLASQGVYPFDSFPAGYTLREVWADGREVVTYFHRDKTAYLRLADDQPRPENLPPAFHWKFASSGILNETTGVLTVYLGDKGLPLWAMAQDGTDIRRIEMVGWGDFTWAQKIARRVAADPASAQGGPSAIPDDGAGHREMEAMLKGETRPEQKLDQAGYRLLEPEDILGKTVEAIGTSVTARTYYGTAGLSRRRDTETPDGVVHQVPTRKFGGVLVREDWFDEESFWTKDGRTGIMVTRNGVTGARPSAKQFVIVGAGNFVDGWERR